MFFNIILGVLTEAQLKLVEGGRSWGRVQVKYMGVWSTMCDFHLASNIAKPLCRMMGYTNGTQVKQEFNVICTILHLVLQGTTPLACNTEHEYIVSS